MPLSEDDGFKYLLGKYPDEALALLCPEMLALRGPPREALLLATEVPVLAHDGSHRLMDLARHIGRGGGAVDQDAALVHAACRAVGAERDLKHVAVVAHAGKDEIGAARRCRRRVGDSAFVGLCPQLGPLPRAIEYGQRMPACRKVSGHGKTHDPKSDECDFRHFYVPTMIR